MSHYPPVSPWAAGLGGKCPRCGQGPLFKTFLGLNERCSFCALDLASADSGDGPAVFVMFLVGPIAVAIAFVARFVWFASIPVAFAIAGGVTVLLTLALLRPFKAALIALQYKHKAEEGRLVE
ncbi:MAG: DUF983 domain-containing protein [Parvularculaceae bacterium]|nr:DUF983 domain-containing protein [Parvularculaceae bacterium]